MGERLGTWGEEEVEETNLRGGGRGEESEERGRMMGKRKEGKERVTGRDNRRGEMREHIAQEGREE